MVFSSVLIIVIKFKSGILSYTGLHGKRSHQIGFADSTQVLNIDYFGSVLLAEVVSDDYDK